METEELIDVPALLQQFANFFVLGWGQNAPNPPNGQQWQMSNNALYYFVQAMNNSFMLMQAQVAALSQAMGARFADLEPRLALAEANMSAMLLGLTANAAADALTEAKAEKTRLQLVQDETRLAAVEARQTLQDIQLAGNATAIAAAQTAVAVADQKAEAAKQKAEAAGAAVILAQSTADNAKSIAQSAQQAQAALSARIKTFRVTVPAVSILVGTPQQVPVTIPAGFTPTALYSIELLRANGGLLNIDLGYVNKLAGTFTMTLRNTGLATLASPGGVVDVTVIADS